MEMQNTDLFKFRLIDFDIYDDKSYPMEIGDELSTSTFEQILEISKPKKKIQKQLPGNKKTESTISNTKCVVQLFGKDTKGATYSVYVQGFKPYFYLKVDDDWTNNILSQFAHNIINILGKRYKSSIASIELVEKKTLYGFDNNKYFKFVKISFHNLNCYNKTKQIFLKYVDDIPNDDANTSNNNNGEYDSNEDEDDQVEVKKKQIEIVLPFNYRDDDGNLKETIINIYEPNVPPLLRFFHVYHIKPSGWVSFNSSDTVDITSLNTSYIDTCENHFHIFVDNIKPIECDDIVPIKICSFDIEALSSNGDFPLAKKNYKKVATQIKEYFEGESTDDYEYTKSLIECMILSAFGYENCDYIDTVDVKKTHTQSDIEKCIKILFKTTTKLPRKKKMSFIDCITYSHDKMKQKPKMYQHKRDELIEIMCNILDISFKDYQIKGDIVTFIGSTFIRYGESQPYLNHCVVLDTCEMEPNNKDEIVSVKTEADVLLKWKDIILREDPDIIIGYNIFGFDYSFIVTRANELNDEYKKKYFNTRCLCREFLNISRKKRHTCQVKNTSITIASGTHDLTYINMPGRIQIDLYNYFRRDYNLESYKLDYVSGYFIRNSIRSISSDGTWIDASPTGLKLGFYIHIEEVGHSSDYYDNGAKFKVIEIDEVNNRFRIDNSISPDTTKKLLWCLAKDDVTPQDIFRMTREGPKERGVIAKYCIQDCNLVHYLLKKIDVITGFVEMANLCSVPISYLVMRGQGIKLFSFIVKKCMEVDTVIPFIEKKNDGGYEGAIVLPPKCGLYLDEPVAVVDYSSLYPSSMISENISHDSKVWTKHYDLNGKLINETTYGCVDGTYTYDNLPGIEYVDIEYDHYEYMTNSQYESLLKKMENQKIKLENTTDDNNDNVDDGENNSSRTSSTTLKKVKVGKKLSRWAQFPEDKKAIMPSILEQLLKARKLTRTRAKYKTVTTNIGSYSGLIINKDNEHTTLRCENGDIKVFDKQSIKCIEDTYDSFMKNVLDKRQLAIKVTANSLYGQCGAKTSSFYEQDVAASTTSTGRKLLTYAKRIVEDVYGNRKCTTKYGTVHSNAEYIYGDSVTFDTPIFVKTFRQDDNGNLVEYCKFVEIGNLASISEWQPYDRFKENDTVNAVRREKQHSSFIHKNVYVWTKNGWKKIRRVIRHKCNKNIFRVKTNKGIIDVTEDHSLIDSGGNYIKPNDTKPGNELYYHSWNDEQQSLGNTYISSDARISRSSSYSNDGCYNSTYEQLSPQVYISSIMNTFDTFTRRHSKSMNKTVKYEYGIYDLYRDFSIPYNKPVDMKSYLMGVFIHMKSLHSPLDIVYKDKNVAIQVMCILRSIYDDVFKLNASDTNKEAYTYKINCIDPVIEIHICDEYQVVHSCYKKNIPDYIINGDPKVVESFLMGYIHFYLGYIDIEQDDLMTYPFYVDSKILLAQLYHLFDYIKIPIITDVCDIENKDAYYFQFASRHTKRCIIKEIVPLFTQSKITRKIEENNNETNEHIDNASIMKSVCLTDVKELVDEFVFDIETEDGTFNCGFPIIVKNTDSVFMSFKLKDENGNKVVGKEALKHTIELAKEVGILASSCLKSPHDLEYEKTFMPFCLLSKKRYVGMLYEEDPDICKRKSMGIVLKRRDNAPIVKDVYGGIIDILMKEQDINKAIQFTKTCLQNLVDKKCTMDKLIITKSLRSYYKNPMQIAHKVLADRIGKRDPGNKPSSGDRIPFVYIDTKKKRGQTILQGDKIEHPDFIKNNKNVKIDYGFYITNQIMKPVLQLFAIVLEQMKEFRRDDKAYKNKIEMLKHSHIYGSDEEKRAKKIQSIREDYIKHYLFSRYIMDIERMRNSQRSIMDFTYR